MEYTLKQIAAICQGTLSEHSNPKQIINTVSIDSRQIDHNGVFVALYGEKYDSHQFVASSLAQGAVAAMVHKDASLQIPNLIQVEDTIRALGKLAHYHRQQFQIPIIAITGSNGKTTIKEMLKAICCHEYGDEHVLATSGNLNNHLGLPLTLLKCNTTHKIAILEMGMNHAGELDYLSHIASPTIATVNNVMFAHAGFFDDLPAIAKAKGEIYNGLVANGIACINRASPFANLWVQELTKTKRQIHIVQFGCENSICYLKAAKQNGMMLLGTEYGDVECKLQILGEHNKVNAVTAAALALTAKCHIANIKSGLESYTGFAGRLERKLAFNGALIVDDSYNANPDSVKAAILAITKLPKPHWFVLADLGELGKFSEEAHHELGAFASDHDIDHLITVGQLTKITHGSFTGDKIHFKHNTDVVKYCLQHLPGDATVLVKGSHAMNLAEVVNGLVQTQV